MSSYLVLELEPDAEPIRIDRMIRQHTDRYTRAQCQRLIKAGSFTLNGKLVRLPSTMVKPGDRVEALIPEREPTDAAPVAQDIELDVVYEDAQIAVVDKPAGIAVHAGAGRQDGTLVNALLARYPEMSTLEPKERPGIVHRLDMDTSGLMVVARTPFAASRLIADIKARQVERRYIALVLGQLPRGAGLIDRPIGRHPTRRTRQSVIEGDKPARTRFASRGNYKVGDNYVSLVELKLETGRTHQIRVHLQAIGYPIIGDPTYGVSLPALPLDRQFLHAYRLEFEHPETRKRLAFESSLPGDLRRIMARVGPSNTVTYGRVIV